LWRFSKEVVKKCFKKPDRRIFMAIVQNIMDLITFVDIIKRGKPSQVQGTWLFS